MFRSTFRAFATNGRSEGEDDALPLLDFDVAFVSVLGGLGGPAACAVACASNAAMKSSSALTAPPPVVAGVADDDGGEDGGGWGRAEAMAF